MPYRNPPASRFEIMPRPTQISINKNNRNAAEKMTFRKHLDQYLDQASLHGLRYIGDRTLTWFERWVRPPWIHSTEYRIKSNKLKFSTQNLLLLHAVGGCSAVGLFHQQYVDPVYWKNHRHNDLRTNSIIDYTLSRCDNLQRECGEEESHWANDTE